MSRRQSIQTAEGTALEVQPYGILQYVSKSAPAGGETGFAPGCEWFVMKSNTNTYNTGLMYTNIGGNGYNTGLATANPTAVWLETDPSSGQQFQFGSGTANMLGSGNMYRKVFGSGQAPASTGSDIVIDVYSLPANSLDGIGNRNLQVTAGGSITGSDATTCKLIFNATTAVVGSAVSGGTTIATTGSMSLSSSGWLIQGSVWKYGVANSNTQIYQETAAISGTTHGGVGAPAAITATENAAILICVTANVTTTAADCKLWWWDVQGFN